MIFSNPGTGQNSCVHLTSGRLPRHSLAPEFLQ